MENEQIETQEEVTLRDEIKAEIKAEVKDELKKEFTRKGAVSAPAVAVEDDWDFSEFILAVGKTQLMGREREQAHELLENKYRASERMKAFASKHQLKDLTQGTAANGGYLVPEQWEQNLFAVNEPDLALVGKIPVIPMTGAVLKIPTLDHTVTPSSGTSAFFSGLGVAVINEASAGTETQPAFKQVSMTASRIGTYTQISEELVRNSNPAVAGIVTNLLPGTLRSYQEYCIINGASPYTGIVGHAATIKVPRATANRIKLVDLAKMLGKFIGSDPVWIFNKTCTSEVITLEDANGNNVYLPQTNVGGALGSTIFGIPFVFSQYNPTVGSEGDVMLVDRKGYAMGENLGVTIQASKDFAFTQALVTYRADLWGAGKPYLTAPIKLADGTATVSNMVVLDDATS